MVKAKVGSNAGDKSSTAVEAYDLSPSDARFPANPSRNRRRCLIMMYHSVQETSTMTSLLRKSLQYAGDMLRTPRAIVFMQDLGIYVGVPCALSACFPYIIDPHWKQEKEKCQVLINNRIKELDFLRKKREEGERSIDRLRAEIACENAKSTLLPSCWNT